MRFQFLSVSRYLAFLALLLSSCAILGVPRRVAFNEAEFAPYRGAGSGSVAGQLVTSSGGEVHIGSGVHVTLLPVTAYTKEMVDRIIGNGEILAPSDARLHPYVRIAKTDDGGRFVFDHVPPGEYFVTGLNEWYVGDDSQYQWACERITVGKGQKVNIQVSKNLQRPGRPTYVVWALQ